MSWIVLGNLVALVADSGGPCFYGEFYGRQPFQPLFDRLNSVAQQIHPLTALNIQQYIIEQYRTGADALGQGISAFPSMHVAIAMLIALFFFDINKFAGYLGFIFCALILVGSVILGWHYAVDGLASMVAVAVLWALAGWMYGAIQKNRSAVPTAGPTDCAA
jgi:membrane-associated phospholipid phosphatase